jgi:hypothetical protein
MRLGNEKNLKIKLAKYKEGRKDQMYRAIQIQWLPLIFSATTGITLILTAYSFAAFVK